MTLATAFAALAERVGTATGAPYWDGRVIDQAEVVYDAGGSIIDPGEPTFRTCRVQIDVADERIRNSEGYASGDSRFIILAATLSGTLNTDAEVEVLAGPHAGQWLVSALERDPAAIGWVGRGRKT